LAPSLAVETHRLSLGRTDDLRVIVICRSAFLFARRIQSVPIEHHTALSLVHVEKPAVRIARGGGEIGNGAVKKT